MFQIKRYLIRIMIPLAVVSLAGIRKATAQFPDRPEVIISVSKRPIPGNLASAARHIRLDEAKTHFRVSGRGVGVAVIGTGVRGDHIDFQESPGMMHFEAITDPLQVRPDNDQNDAHGMATFVAGLIAANGINRGVAREAQIVSVRALNNWGGGKFADVAKSLEWVLEQNALPIHVVCLAVSDGGHYESMDQVIAKYSRLGEVENVERIQRAILELKAKRIAVVAPAGDAYGVNGNTGIAFPAILEETISVGGVFDSDWGRVEFDHAVVAHSTGEDRLSPTTQRSERTTIFAPCGPGLSTGSSSATAQAYQREAGTINAAGIASGVIALMQDYHQRQTGKPADVDQIIGWLRQGGVPVTDGDDERDNVEHTNLTLRRLDALGAIAAMNADFKPQTDTGTPVPLATTGFQPRNLDDVAAAIRLGSARRDFTISRRKLDGSGLTVAIIDSGLSAQSEFHVKDIVDFTGTRNGSDEIGTGTHSAGVIAAHGMNMGIAPASNVVALKVITRDRNASFQPVAEALDWVLQRRANLNVSVVLLGVGEGSYSSAEAAIQASRERQVIQDRIRQLKDARIVTVCPAGNGHALEIGESMAFPAIIPETLSVGALQFDRRQIYSKQAAQHTASGMNLDIAPYSQRHSRATDIFAPGGPVVSTGHEREHAVLRGTSVAASVTAGVVLLMQQYYQASLNELPPVDDVQRWLLEGSVPVSDNRGGTVFRQLDVYNSMKACRLTIVNRYNKQEK